MDADTGQIVASLLTANDVDDGSQVGFLLDQIPQGGHHRATTHNGNAE